jgi:two-component system capsular synthesis response regulator RcsB
VSKTQLARLRIVLADDHPIFRIGLRAVLEQDQSVEVVAEAGGPQELLDCLALTPCDLLVTDFMMPVGQQTDGLRLLEGIRRRWPEVPVLVVTMLNNAGLFRSILNLGVLGLVGKGSLANELPEAINHLRAGKVYIAQSVNHVLLTTGDVAGEPGRAMPQLSPRELEVVRLLAAGKSVGEIALHLNRSKQTVSAQKSNAMRKVGVSNQAALFIYLQENGLT